MATTGGPRGGERQPVDRQKTAGYDHYRWTIGRHIPEMPPAARYGMTGEQGWKPCSNRAVKAAFNSKRGEQT